MKRMGHVVPVFDAQAWMCAKWVMVYAVEEVQAAGSWIDLLPGILM